MLKSLSSSMIQYFVSPIVVGFVVLLGQLFVQPYIAERSLARQELWRSKFNAYVEAIEVVNQKFLSLDWKAPGVTSTYTRGEPPTDEKVNNAYAKLALLAGDPKVPHAYLACFGVYPAETPVKTDNRTDFIALCRKDLGSTSPDLDPKDV